MKRINCHKPISRPLLKLVAFSSIVIVTSCSDNTQSSEPAAPSDPVLLEPEVSDPLPPDPQSDPLQPVITSLRSQYPVDTHNDDRPGLIITGINADENQNPVSSYLLSASAFRLERQTPGSGDGYAHMLVYDEAMPVSEHIDFYQPPLNSCLLRDIEGEVLDVSDVVYASDSGGASVVVNSPSGPWFTFDRLQSEYGRYAYQVDNELPGRLPLDATLSVPGDVFPNVPAYPIFEPEAPVRLSPTIGQSFTPGSKFTWVPGAASGYVKINLLAYDASQEFMGFLVTCWAEDNGQFEMPASVTEYVESSELTIKVRYSRVYARLDRINDMVIHQSIEVAE
jgi:hypothetical protein